MTERTLLLRTATGGRYFMLATDFPSARVFDTATSRLACVVELPPRSRASLAALSLTSVALGTLAAVTDVKRKASAKTSSSSAVTVGVAALGAPMMAAVGLSNGTVLVHDVAKDELVGHLSVSETQHAIIGLVIQDGFLFCLAANNTFYVLDISGATALGHVVLKVRTQADASALAVVAAGHEDGKKKALHTEGGRHVFQVLVAGPTYALHRLELYRAATAAATTAAGGNGSGRDGGDSAARAGSGSSVSEKQLSFASQGTAVDYAWLGVVPATTAATDGTDTMALAAVTASANEGVVRVWDLSTSSSSGGSGGVSSMVGRCRRTLLCGQRIANLSVLDLTAAESNAGSSRGGSAVYVLATAFTGALLLWNLGTQLLPRVVEPTPLQPTAAFFSSSPAARLLYGVLLRSNDPSVSTNNTAVEQPASDAVEATAASTALVDAEVSLLLLRGKFALPQFEFVHVQRLLAEQDARLNGSALAEAPNDGRDKQLQKQRKTASSLGLGISAALTLVEVPTSTVLSPSMRNKGEAGTTDAAGNAFHVIDTAWAIQRRQLATRALMTPTESFATAHAYQAPTLKDLPVKQLTLEQRLRALSADVSRQAASRAAAEFRSRQGKHSARNAPGDDDDSDHNEMLDDDDVDSVGDVDAAAAGSPLPSLGLATVPLYQALHANDVSAVMELLSVAARSPEGMKATVVSLQLPYALQLMGIIAERLGITSAKSTVSATAASESNGGSHSKLVVGGAGGLSAVSTRSPLLLWLDTLVHYRGMELYAAQLSCNRSTSSHETQKLAEEKGAPDPEAATESTPRPVAAVSPPKDFIGPVLHQYRSMCSTYDKLATLHGRLSVFNAVRPSEKNQFVNRPRKMLSSNIELARTPAALSGKLDATHTVQDDDILFPAMFTELRTRQGPHVVRVRSKLAKEVKRRRLATTDKALLKKAKQMAKEDRKQRQASGGANNEDDMDDATLAAALGTDESGMPVGDDDDIDLEALEALGLDSSDTGSGEDESDASDFSSASGEAEDAELGMKKKATRKERESRTVTDEMIADERSSIEDDDESEDHDADLDSSDPGADFARESDDEVHSEVLDFSDKESGEDSSSDEEGSSSDSSASGAGDKDLVPRGEDDSDGSSSEGEYAGMGDDMVELLASVDEGNDDAKQERRKNKRVRTD